MLRTSAEDLASQMPDTKQKFNGNSTIEVIHELRVHQIELEIQNEELKKAHLELELSRDRYQDLYDFAPVGYFTLTDKGLIEEVNLTGASLLGVERLKLKRARFRRFVTSKDYDVWDRFFLNLMRDDGKKSAVIILKRSDKTEVHARIEGIRVRSDEEVYQVRILVQDISDQIEAEEKIRILAEMADVAPASLMVHDFDGNILYANEESFRLHGFSREEFLAKNLHEIDASESEQYIAERMQKIRESGEAEFEVRHYLKDGGTFPLQVYGKMVSWAGRQVVLSVSTDLTEKKRIEQLRINSEKQYRNLIRDIPDYILVHRNGTILFVNQAAASALKYTPEEMIGTSVLSYVASASQSLVSHNIQKRMTGENIPPFEITILTKDGTEKNTEVQGTLIQYEGDTASLIVLNDITERKLAEKSLQEAVKKLHLLTSLTRHDINNQLTAIQLLHDIVLETKDPGKIHGYISQAQEVGKQIERVIGFTREYENFGTVSSGWHQVYSFIELAKHEPISSTINFRNLIPDNLEIYADQIIRKVFTTLIDNSIRHGVNVQTISFSCHKDMDSLIISFEDDGIGIPFDEKERIFENGYGKNTGIGLYLAREILSITGLFIRECGIEGKGSKFEIVVPAGKFRRGI